MKFLKWMNILLIIAPFILVIANLEKLTNQLTYKWTVLFEITKESGLSLLISIIILSIMSIVIIDIIKNKNKKNKKRFEILKAQILTLTFIYTYKTVSDNTHFYNNQAEYILLMIVSSLFLSIIYTRKKGRTEEVGK